jgi:hypothetical protein
MSFPCPKCRRPLEPNGEITLNGVKAPLDVYQCPECTRVVDLFGEPIEVALTFAVGPDGVAFDPADPDADLSAAN